MRYLLLPLAIACCVLIGCEYQNAATKPANDTTIDDRDRVAKLKQLILETTQDEWVSTGESSEFFDVATYGNSDLVPCPDDQAEFILEICAMSDDHCFYQRRQSFRQYEPGAFDPKDEPGVFPEHLACEMMVNGFASGSFQYTRYSAKSATIKIEWTASQNENSQQFEGEFNVVVNESGTANAGNGNKFDWSFMPANKN